MKTRVRIAPWMAGILACGGAHAQSSLTLFGVVDATLARGTGSVSSRNQLTHSGLASSRLGLRGTEDLGGGLAASFWLEAGINNDNGQGAATNANNQTPPAAAPAGTQGITFNRRSTVSLSGAFGEFRFGRDYTPHFWNTSLYDPFGLVGVGTNQLINSPLSGPTQARASNGISYFLPRDLGGFHGQVQVALGENNSGTPTEKDGNMLGFRAGYAMAPIDIAIASSKTRYATGDITVSNIAAAYQFASARVSGELYRDRVDSPVAVKGRGFLLGLAYTFGLSEVRAAASRHEVTTGAQPTTSKLAVGYVYNLSKRTALYTTYARLHNTGGAAQALNGAVTAPGQGSSGLDIGLRHAF